MVCASAYDTFPGMRTGGYVNTTQHTMPVQVYPVTHIRHTTNIIRVVSLYGKNIKIKITLHGAPFLCTSAEICTTYKGKVRHHTWIRDATYDVTFREKN
jgi:hypothetical protein